MGVEGGIGGDTQEGRQMKLTRFEEVWKLPKQHASRNKSYQDFRIIGTLE